MIKLPKIISKKSIKNYFSKNLKKRIKRNDWGKMSKCDIMGVFWMASY